MGETHRLDLLLAAETAEWTGFVQGKRVRSTPGELAESKACDVMRRWGPSVDDCSSTHL